MLTVCPEKVYILHGFIIEIEERRKDYAKAFVFSILFKEITHADYDQTLSRLKTILASSMTQNGPERIKTIFNLLLKKGNSFLLENENSIAIAIFNQILELLDTTQCSESLKKELEFKTKGYLEKATQNAKPPVNRINWQNLEGVLYDKPASTVVLPQRKDSLSSEISESGSGSISSVTSSQIELEASSSQYAPDEIGRERNSVEGPSSTSDETSFQTVKNRKKEKRNHATVVLPEGIEVICEHFEKKSNSVNFSVSHNSSLPTIAVSKVCKGCESRCFYAFWSTKFGKWFRVRKHPSYLVNYEFHSCRNYKNGELCEKGCTHPHGPELEMWKMQRDPYQVLPSPENWFKSNGSKVQPLTLSKNAEKRYRKKQNQEAAAATTQPSTVARQPPTINKPSSSSSNVYVLRPQTKQPTLPVQQKSHSQQTSCYLPKEVKFVCQHFMLKYRLISIGILQKKNVCEKCHSGRVKNSIKYAFWSAKFQKWFLIRKRPTSLSPHTAFKECKDFIKGRTCIVNSCTFGHGPEVVVWTMDREEVLVLPEIAYNLSIKDESTRVTRPLPVGGINGSFKLCQSLQSRRFCWFGRCCHDAHSEEELRSWQEEYKQKMAVKPQQPATNTVQPRQLSYKTTESMSGVTLSCEPENPNVILNETVDVHEHEWTFHIRYETDSEKKLPCIFLGERYCGHFRLKSVKTDAFDKSNKLLKSHNVNMENKLCYRPTPSDVSLVDRSHVMEAQVIVQFRASVFGSFTQRIVFDFGNEPLLMKEFNIDVISLDMKDTLPQLISAREELSQERLTHDERNIVRMQPLEDESLFARYGLPKDAERIVSAQMVEGGQMRRDTYIPTMHQVLFAEEAHMRNMLSKFTPSSVKLSVTRSYTRESLGLKLALDGYFFGTIELQANVTPDDKAGRICIRNVQTVLLQARDGPTLLYEVPIELLEETQVTIKLFPRLCEDLKIVKENQEIDVRMWFNVNRTILCRMHKALDSLNETHKRHLFPVKQATLNPQTTQESFYFPWLRDLNQSLNEDQLRVIQAITDTSSPSQPLPLVVFGPFGTGKTFTLNKAILHLLTKSNRRILLCTHTNSAADIHVELLDKYLKSRNALKAAKPLRIVDPERNISTMSETSRKYALITDGAFVMPSRKDLNNHSVIVTTLTTADLLTKLNVHHGFFTHILIDEAAQAWETEALIPVALAGPNTKIVFTGDHMQMSPEVYTKFACQWGLQKSLPERLFDHYGQMDDEDFRDQHVMFLRFNYRSNKDILQFPSDNFYGGEIVAMGDHDNPPHPVLGPLMFYSSKGKDVKQQDNTYFNEAEVSEVVKRVKELADSWPNCWGAKDLKEIAVIAPYLYQVKTIRGELRKRRLTNVTVETIHNVQGKEFRALFISTVRTWNSIKGSSEDLSLEFLSDPKLLITAVTRAKSLVAVVGDPVSLCTIGDCKYLWMDFIQRCEAVGRLHGTTMADLKQEIVIQRQLNPEAECFVPRSTATTEGENEYVDIDDQELHEDLQTETESKADDSSTCSNDVESDSIEEESPVVGEELRFDVLPSDYDQIVKAFINYKASKITQASPVEDPEEEEWPSLPGTSSGRERPIFSRLQSSDYEMRREHGGREEIRLTELNKKPSERGCVSRPEHLSSEALSRMLESDPSRYLIGQLRVGVDGWRKSFVQIPDKNKPDVKIRGDVRPAFDMDTVVLDKEKLQEDSAMENKSDCVLGILNHLIDPRERQYVCKLDQRHSWLMVPTNKSVTKIANLTDRSCSKIPIYKKTTKNNQEIQRMVGRKEAKKKKYMFVVQFLQWRSDCYYPLGCVRRTITQGETVEDCMRILDAEHNVRRASNRQIKPEVDKLFPPEWKIPKPEKSRRKSVKNAFTIDPPESKDLDDAVSVEKMDDGNYKVGIHIADVSYFVKPGSKVDEDARQRGTTYYPGIPSMENIPMLPRELSEKHCSLLEQEDRLTQSVYVTLDSEGQVIQERPTWAESDTRSLCQLSYSDAQKVIEGEELKLGNHIPEEDKRIVQESIQVLHSLMQKVRRRRLGDGDHSEDERNDIAAHELIEEMMILANRTVGTILRASSREQIHPGTIPFVCQLQPKVHRFNQWAAKYGQFAKYLPSLRRYLQSEDIEEDVREGLSSTVKDIDIQETFWSETCRTATSEKLPMLEFLICDPNCSPQFQSASRHLRSIQIRSEYKCSIEDATHHSLAVSDYVHFTSPIRRYVDIEIHRRLKGEQVDLDIEQIEKFCRRSTFIKHNSTKFGKECKRISFSHSLKESTSNLGIEAYVDDLANHSFVIQPRDPEQDLLSRNRRISIEDLSVHSKTDLKPDDKQELTLTWRVRVYVSPSLEESKSDKRIVDPKHRERKPMKTLLSSALQGSKVYRIDGEKWLKLVEASVDKDLSKVTQLIEAINQECNSSDCYGSQIKVKPCDVDGHYYEVEMNLRQFDIVHVQLFSRLFRAILCPDIQLFKISSNFNICLEHQKLPRRCFVKDHHDNASKEWYEDIDDYIEHWKPVLAMETATEAVSQNEGYLLKSHHIKWTKGDEEIKGTFTLQESFCTPRHLKFQFGDFACVRIPQYEDESNKDQSAKQPRNIWVGHCIVQNVEQPEKNSTVWTVELVMHNMASDMPEEFLDGNSHPCELEIIYQPVPCRRMNMALNSELKKSSELVHSICLGRMPAGGGFKVPSENLSLSQHYVTSVFKELNGFQKSAVEDALQNSFSMIQGPPGTGKTVTGVHIAYWFAKQNLELKKTLEKEKTNTENDVKDRESDEEKPVTNAPPQVLYCGPSNKSVDVVTEYLLRIPHMKTKILRVYGSLIEEQEYPIPNKIARPKPPRSDDELKIPEDQVKDVALHHLIRSPSSPYETELRRLEDVFRSFREAQKKRLRPSDADVKKYRETIEAAEKWAIEGKEIILCTCSIAGSIKIRKNCNIVQCIVDECGMTMEPEVLIPMTSSKTQQIVLIGDHKQLQPIIVDREAEKLGLVRSMFERLSTKAKERGRLKMLKIQYRMHPSICDFPSKHFYEEQLVTDNSAHVRCRLQNEEFWPTTNKAIAFCHVGGTEMSSVISSSDSGVDSKYNELEANKAVQIAKCLVNKYKIKKTDVVILTPYRQQRKIIADRLKGAYEDISVTTIIKSQGSEWDYVIISLVRSLPEKEIDENPSFSWLSEHIGFIANEHQINVALTRAKKGLCVIGNKNLLRLNKTWSSLLEHYEEHHCVVDGSQWP